MSKANNLMFSLNVLMAAALIGFFSQASASGTTTTLNAEKVCADLKTGILRLPDESGCSESEKKVSFGSSATQQKSAKSAIVYTRDITVLNGCPYSNFVTGVSYNKSSTWNPISTTTTRILCSTVRVVVP